MLWRHHAFYLMDKHYRKDDCKCGQPRNNAKFKIGETVLVKNYACHAFDPKYLIDYRVPNVLNESTLLLVTPNDKQHKTNINDANPATTLKII